jgi:F0F1-type ATP synthase gamma subunit
MLDIIRGKNFAEFTEKEIKDVDIVRSRFNSFVNDYYQLLDMFYTYKKNKEKGEKEDVSILLKQEKQIEQLKNIVLEYKTNLEKFKMACETKVAEEKVQVKKRK